MGKSRLLMGKLTINGIEWTFSTANCSSFPEGTPSDPSKTTDPGPSFPSAGTSWRSHKASRQGGKHSQKFSWPRRHGEPPKSQGFIYGKATPKIKMCVIYEWYICMYVMSCHVMSCHVIQWYGMVWYGMVWYACMYKYIYIYIILYIYTYGFIFS